MTIELKELLENVVLSDEVKTELSEAFQAHVQKAVSAKEVELVEQFEEKKAELARDTIEMLEEAVAEEFKALQDEIVEARSLDIRYAIKMEEFKEQFAEAKSAELEEMMQETIRAEMDELRESLEEARKNIVGKRMFEAFVESYGDLVEGEDAASVRAQLEEAKKELDALKREKKIDELVEGFTGRKRNVIKTILEGVATDKLEERAAEVIESLALSESADDEAGKGKEKKLDEAGDEIPEGSTVVLEEGAIAGGEKVKVSELLKRARRQAGLDN